MQAITTVGLDIAKSVFQVHGVDAGGQVVIRRQLKRRYVLTFFENLAPCLVGIEACASSHYWSRELQALGHSVRLMPPVYVKPYVKRQKNDMADAEAICEAVTRVNMRFVPIKTTEQQGVLMLHRTRHLFIRQQTQIVYRGTKSDLLGRDPIDTCLSCFSKLFYRGTKSHLRFGGAWPVLSPLPSTDGSLAPRIAARSHSRRPL